MTIPRITSIAAFTLTALIGASIPYVVSGSMHATYLSEDNTITTSDGTRVPIHRATNTRSRVEFNQAMLKYNALTQLGRKNLPYPDINYPKTIDYYKGITLPRVQQKEDISATPLSTKDYVPPAADVQFVEEISVEERGALLRAEKIGRCDYYKGFSAGYMAICKKFIAGKKKVDTTGLGNDIQFSREQAKKIRGESKGTSSVSRPLAPKGYEYKYVPVKSATRKTNAARARAAQAVKERMEKRQEEGK